MKIKAASMFGVTLALAVMALASPAQARDNNGYGNYLSSGVSNNFNGGCDSGNRHGRGPRAFGNQFQNQYANQGQVGIYPTPFSGNTAYGYNQNAGLNSFAYSQDFLNERAKLQAQLSYGNLSVRDRDKLLNKLAKLEAKAFNQNNFNNGSNIYNNNNYNANNGFLSNLRNQYLNNGVLNNGVSNNNLANAGYVNQVRGLLGF